MYSVNDMISRLPDFFKKLPGSNNFKLITIISEQFEDVKRDLDLIKAWRSIDEAEGTTLDAIGADVKQPRGKANDVAYRILIKSKIARNHSDGTIDAIIHTVSVALSIPKEQVRIVEKWNDPLEPEPAAIKMIEMPLDKIAEAGMDPINLVRIVQKATGGGVKVHAVEMNGTFEFGDLDTVSVVDKGFGDVNNNEIGGYLGAVFGAEPSDNLPI